MAEDTTIQHMSIKEMLDKVQLGEILDQALEGFQVIDSDWRYVFVNQTVAEQGKYTKDQLLGHTMMELYPNIENTPLFGRMQEVMTNRVSVRFENQFIFPDNSSGWFQLYIHPWKNGIMIFSVDITERKKLEEGLAQKVQELEELEKSGMTQEKIAELKTSLDQLRMAGNKVVGDKKL